MTSYESSAPQPNWTGENPNQPFDTPEIQEHIAGLLKRVNEIVVKAPEAPHWDTLAPVYHWASRQVINGHHLEKTDVTLVAGETKQQIWEGIQPEGAVLAIRQPHWEPDQSARNRFNHLVTQAEEENNSTASLTHILRREIIIADATAEQRITATSHVREGKFEVVSANLQLIRPLTGAPEAYDKFFQKVSVSRPSPYNSALWPQDYITDKHGLLPKRDAEARDLAAAVLREDPTFPIGELLGLRQIEAFLK